ncbi:hypothetical protein FQA39_LY02183 [Lamprigera yunnana]|nr:hypothetical protein FQA39_LY02183 [Lamprigera yunnana]
MDQIEIEFQFFFSSKMRVSVFQQVHTSCVADREPCAKEGWPCIPEVDVEGEVGGDMLVAVVGVLAADAVNRHTAISTLPPKWSHADGHIRLTKMLKSLYKRRQKNMDNVSKQKMPINEETQAAKISPEKWTAYFNKIYKEQPEDVSDQEEETTESNGVKDISNEMTKYDRTAVTEEIMILFQKIIWEEKIPDDQYLRKV